MTDRRDADLTRLIRDLTRELQRLQRELEPDRRGRFPTPRELSRVTGEVAIPAAILLLETQIRALQLLRRLLRIVEGRDPQGRAGDGSGTAVRRRAEQLGTTTLSRLDSALAAVQEEIDESDADGEAAELLAEARDLQARIRDELEAASAGTEPAPSAVEPPGEPVGIDVEAELESLKETVDAGDEGGGASTGDSDADGSGKDERDGGGSAQDDRGDGEAADGV